MACGVILIVLIFAKLVAGTSLNRLAITQITLLFFAYNLLVIMLMSADAVGTSMAVGAFLYDYSLLLLVLPYFWISGLSPLRKSQLNEFKIWIVILAVFVLIADLYGMLEFVSNDYLLSASAIEKLESGDHIKFDHIGGLIRVSSFFKSPLEFGIINVLASGVTLSLVLSGRKGWIYWSLLMVYSAGVFITISRTAMFMYFCNVLLIVLYFFTIKKWVFSISKRALGTLAGGAIFATISFLFIDLDQYIATSTSSTNFQIRLENWEMLIAHAQSDTLWLWFGQGIVQNGAFGDYHSVVIDNMYLGAVLTGGLVGLTVFVGLCIGASMLVVRQIREYEMTPKILSFSLVSFFLAFLMGGLTENLMHLMFYAFFALLASQLIPSTYATADSNFSR
jgi:hypothetical protein